MRLVRLFVVAVLAVSMVAVTPDEGAAGQETGEDTGITGTVTDLSGAPISGVSIEAVRVGDADADVRASRYHGTTAEDGTYSIIPMPSGKWTVHFMPQYPAVEAWYGGGLVEWRATPVNVAEGDTVVVDQTLQATGGAGVAVYVMDIDPPATDGDVRPSDARNGCVEFFDGSGLVAGSRDYGHDHFMRIPEGTYRVRFRDCLAPVAYMTTWYSEGGGPVNQADRVAISGSWTGLKLYVSGKCGVAWPTIVGTPGDDIVRGTARNDVIATGAGDDRVFGYGGADVVCLGAGTDMASLGDGPDWAFGGDGADRLDGGRGDDYLKGGTGDDRLRGDAGSDELVGSSGADVLVGGPGIDVLDGGPGEDEAAFSSAPRRVVVNLGAGFAKGDGRDLLVAIENVLGSRFGDRIVGSDAANVLNGSDGDDLVVGGAGDDVVKGGPGDDLLKGRAGDDLISGGKGIDVGYGNSGVDTCDASTETTYSC